jgi:hypothetical protein
MLLATFLCSDPSKPSRENAIQVKEEGGGDKRRKDGVRKGIVWTISAVNVPW